MLHATLYPLATSSMPLTRSGSVSNRTEVSVPRFSLTTATSEFCCAAGKSNALRTTTPAAAAAPAMAAVPVETGMDVLNAEASCAFSSGFNSCMRLIKASAICASSVVLARSASTLREMANTSAHVRRVSASLKLWYSVFSASSRRVRRVSASLRAAAINRFRSARASFRALSRNVARC